MLIHYLIELTINPFPSFITFQPFIHWLSKKSQEELEKRGWEGGGAQRRRWWDTRGRVIKEEGMRGGKGSDRRGVSGARGLRESAAQLTCSHY